MHEVSHAALKYNNKDQRYNRTTDLFHFTIDKTKENTESDTGDHYNQKAHFFKKASHVTLSRQRELFYPVLGLCTTCLTPQYLAGVTAHVTQFDLLHAIPIAELVIKNN